MRPKPGDKEILKQGSLHSKRVFLESAEERSAFTKFIRSGSSLTSFDKSSFNSPNSKLIATVIQRFL